MQDSEKMLNKKDRPVQASKCGGIAYRISILGIPGGLFFVRSDNCKGPDNGLLKVQKSNS